MSEVERGRNIKAYPGRTPRPFNPLAADVLPLPRPMTILHIPLPPHFSFNQIPYYTVYSLHLRHAFFTMDYGLPLMIQEPSCQHRYSSMFYLFMIFEYDTYTPAGTPFTELQRSFCSHKHKVLFFASLQICASGYAAFLDNLMCSRSRWDVNLTDDSVISRPTRCIRLLFSHSELCLCFM